MATRRSIKGKEKPKYRCRDCVYARDFHEKNWKGELFMCKCDFYKEGKYSQFLDEPQCEHFKLKG